MNDRTGELNVVAPLISMFFMMTYGLINFACFALEYTKSPGWRPKFQSYSMWGCLLGTVLCIIAMFLTDVMWALIRRVSGVRRRRRGGVCVESELATSPRHWI